MSHTIPIQEAWEKIQKTFSRSFVPLSQSSFMFIVGVSFFFFEYKLVLATVFVISGNSTGLAVIWVCVCIVLFQLSDQARVPAHKGHESVCGMFTPLKEMGDQAENPVLRDLKRTGQI